MAETTDYDAALARHRAARLAALTAADGWLNLTDRVELTPGSHRVGTAPDNDVVLTAGPAHLGILTLTEGLAASFTEPGGEARPFQPVPEAPPRLTVANLLLELHTVEGAPALRVRQIDHPARLAFAGLRYFPTDPRWVIRADWQALAAPERFGIDMVGGVESAVTLTHRARFQHDGRTITLLPTHWKGGKPMFVIRDATSGRETYGASRFLIGEVQGDQVVLDFNTAHNPPCAFTEHAVCPLPPRENILPFAVRAGELAP